MSTAFFQSPNPPPKMGDGVEVTDQVQGARWLGSQSSFRWKKKRSQSANGVWGLELCGYMTPQICCSKSGPMWFSRRPVFQEAPGLTRFALFTNTGHTPSAIWDLPARTHFGRFKHQNMRGHVKPPPQLAPAPHPPMAAWDPRTAGEPKTKQTRP